MNYADQINAFMGDYNEVKNDFLQGESKQTQGAEQLMQQSDIEFGAVSAKEAVGKEAIAFGKKAYSAIKNAAATAETGPESIEMTSFTGADIVGGGGTAAASAAGAGAGAASAAGGGGTAAAGAGGAAAAPAAGGAGAAAAPAAPVAPTSTPTPPSTTVVNDAAVGDDLAEGAAFGLDEVLSAVPVVGAVATVITAIVSAFAGHHEMKNVNSDFTMPESDVDLPSYHPGIN